MHEADLIVEGEYRVPYISHAVLEPHVCVAYLDGYDRLIVVSSTQVPYHTRRQLAAVLQLPISRVRVVKPRVGGGFGSKQEMLLEPVAAVLAMKTRQPVRIEYSRQEEFTAGRFRHPMIIRMRSGVKRDGTLVAISMHSIGNAGAYGTHSLTVTRSTGHKTLCLYRAQAYRFQADAAYTNLPITGAMRGYGAPQGFFALESHIDEIAHRLGMDPLALRRKNHVQKGDWDPIEGEEIDGVWHSKRHFRSCGLPQCLETGAAAMNWHGPFDRGDVADGTREAQRLLTQDDTGTGGTGGADVNRVGGKSHSAGLLDDFGDAQGITCRRARDDPLREPVVRLSPGLPQLVGLRRDQGVQLRADGRVGELDLRPDEVIE